MSSPWDANQSVLLRRFPDVLAALQAAPPLADVRTVDDTPVPTLTVAGIQLTSAYDRVAEANEQAALVPVDAPRIAVYGLGLGDLPRRLLARPALRELEVVLLNHSLAREILARFDQADWLGDPRVRIVLGEERSEVHTPFAALPGELTLATEGSARLRDLVVMELASSFGEERLAAREASFRASAAANREHVATDRDVTELFGSRLHQTVFLAGAGPTLADDYELLRGRKSPLVAVDGALRALLQAGIVPDVVVTVDDHPIGIPRLFDADLSALAGSALVYFPVVAESVIAKWPGRRYVAYGFHARWSGLAAELPRGRLWASGSVTHVAVDLAVKMGAAEIVLFGCDFGFARGRTHVAGNPYDVPAESAGVPGVWVTDVGGGRLATLPNLTTYLRELERYVRAHPEVSFFNASRAGAVIEGVPALARSRGGSATGAPRGQ